MSGYEWIKRQAKERGVPIPELLALSRNNDPFFAGSPAQRERARWFANLWDEFGFVTGVHLRRIHYRIISQEHAPTRHDGTAYENTEDSWNYLCAAAKAARHLGLIDPAAFVDMRNPAPRIHMFPAQDGPGFENEIPEWSLPKIRASLTANLAGPEFWPTGYDYEDALQPYHVEIWCEKSTMNDVLRPLCRRHAVNFVTGVGFMSITNVVALLERVADLEKPCRILYIADFDPAGDSMPKSVARQIEFGIAEHESDVDIKLDPLILTSDQVAEYDLPRTPIKDSDRRKGGWETKHGTGAVELDALEALHPGVLARIVEKRVRDFRDPELRRKVWETRVEARERLEEAWDEQAGQHEEELREIRESVAGVVDTYRERIENLDGEMQAELEPFRERLGSVRRAIQIELDGFEPDLPPLPDPETPQERGGWLFDSRRSYFEQLESYKSRNGDES